MSDSVVTYAFDANGGLIGGGTAPLVGVPAVLDFGPSGASVEAAQLVPLQPVPSQIVSIALADQAVTIKVYGKQIYVPYQPPGAIVTAPPAYVQDFPVFVDLYLNDVLVVGGVLCPNAVTIVRNGYFGFKGDLAFLDTQGSADPLTSGLGARWVLGYWPGLL